MFNSENVSLFENYVARRAKTTITLEQFFSKDFAQQAPVFHGWLFDRPGGKGSRPVIDPSLREPIYNNLFEGAETLGDVQANIEKYVREHGKHDPVVTNAKMMLPAVSVSARFPDRRVKGYSYEHTGLIALDIDSVEVEASKEKLKSLDYVMYAGKSVTGTGVFAIVAVSEPEDRIKHYRALEEDMEKAGLPLDNLPDLQRIRGFSYDPDAYVNEDAEVFTKKKKVEVEEDYYDLQTFEQKGRTTAYDREDFMDACYKKSLRKGNEFDMDEGLNPFLVRTLPYFNMYGISAKPAANFLYNKIKDTPGFHEKYSYDRVEYDVEHFYDVYSHQHHILDFEVVKESDRHREPDQVIYIEKGETLNDHGVNPLVDTIIQAPTGIGKTYWAVNNLEKADILMPTQELTKQAGQDYGKNIVMEGTDVNTDSVQIGTYNAIDKFIKRDTSDRTLVIDEGHSLIFSASRNYRNKVVNKIVDYMKHYRNVIIITATWVENLHPAFENFQRVEVKKNYATEKSFKFVKYGDIQSSFGARLHDTKLNIIYLNDKSKADQYANNLEQKGYKTQLFNASTKEEEGHKAIIEDSYVADDINVLFVTTLFIEGLNIFNDNVGTLHILSKTSPEIIEQIANRTRKAVADEVYIYLHNNSNNEQGNKFDILTRQEEFVKEAQQIVDSGETFKRFGKDGDKSVLAQKIVGMLQNEKKNIIRVKPGSEGEFVVDYLGVAFNSMDNKINAVYRNVNLLIEDMKRYGWKFSGYEKDETGVSEQEKADRQFASENFRAKKKERFRKTIEAIENMGEQVGERYVDKIFNEGCEDRIERDICEKLYFLTEYLYFKDALLLLKETQGSDSAYARLRNQSIIKTYKRTREMDGDKTDNDVTFVEELYRRVRIGERYTSEDIVKILEDIKSYSPKLWAVEFTPKRGMQVLKNFFEIKKVSYRKDDGAVGKTNQIVDNEPLQGFEVKDKQLITPELIPF